MYSRKEVEQIIAEADAIGQVLIKEKEFFKVSTYLDHIVFLEDGRHRLIISWKMDPRCPPPTPVTICIARHGEFSVPIELVEECDADDFGRGITTLLRKYNEGI